MNKFKTIFILAASLLFIHCTSTPLPTVGGKVKALDGTIVLENNDSDRLRIKKDGSFTFADSLLDDNGRNPN